MAGKRGRSGRRKQPAAVKIAKGTHRPKRDADTVDLPAGCPPIPDGLHARAVAEWERLAPICMKAGLIKSADWLAWELGFQALSTYYSASEQIGEFVHVTDKGYPVARPEVAIAKQSWSAVLQFCREFGLTPSARSGLVIDGDFGHVSTDETDPLESLVNA